MESHPTSSALDVRRICVEIDEELILDRVSLTVMPGDLVSLVGPSGSGKSTLLQAIAGLLPLQAGTVHWQGEDITAVPPHQRRFGMVFQEPLLFPHLDVAGNVGYGLRLSDVRTRADAPDGGHRRSADSAVMAARVNELLSMVALDGFGHRRPETLSGGEAQRVALARALAPQPRLLLLDEPFAALDRDLRLRLADDVASLLHASGVTAILVTHDREEAERVGDRVVHLADLTQTSAAE
jgi:thiamine transport system ATP-binding protein